MALASGWIGVAVDSQMPPQEGETPGMGLWLVLPLLTALILIFTRRGAWKDIGLAPGGRQQAVWYALAVVIFPLITALVVGTGYAAGLIRFTHFNINAYCAALFAALLPNFIKNIFEELVWRGYLTRQLIKLQLNDGWIYLISGSVWGLWHIPYYMYFLPESVLQQVLPVGRAAFVAVAVGTMICWTIMYVELYRLAGSIWPVVILHAVEDSVVNHLVIDKHILISPGQEIFVSPICGLLATGCYLFIGLSLRKLRLNKAKTSLLGQFTPA